MGQMVRRQVRIRADQAEFLRRRARELAISGSALVRQAIDSLSRTTKRGPSASVAAADAEAFIEARARLVVPPGQRTWTRDDVYEERLERIVARSRHLGRDPGEVAR